MSERLQELFGSTNMYQQMDALAQVADGKSAQDPADVLQSIRDGKDVTEPEPAKTAPTSENRIASDVLLANVVPAILSDRTNPFASV